MISNFLQTKRTDRIQKDFLSVSQCDVFAIADS